MTEQETQSGETIVVIGQGCWGKGPDLRSARREWIRQGGTMGGGYEVVTLDSETEMLGVDPVWGQIHYKGNEPTSRAVEPTRKARR